MMTAHRLIGMYDRDGNLRIRADFLYGVDLAIPSGTEPLTLEQMQLFETKAAAGLRQAEALARQNPGKQYYVDMILDD